jgi:glycerophosphoryl diester phosphodiesterase
MIDPVSVTRDGHRTFLKWHRARRRVSDPVFTGRRILEGMALGASVEVDLVRHRDNGLAVLHDHLAIERETTGSGPSITHTAAELRALNLRGNDGAPITDHVMLLEDLCALLAQTPPHPDALLQLDYKEGQGTLPPELIAAFAHSVGPVARNMILSSGEAVTVEALTSATPGLHIGYDPCHNEWVERVQRTKDFAGFVAAAIDASPRAEMIYLAWQLVLFADDNGFDIIGAFHAAGRRIDAYTLKTTDAETGALANRLLSLKVDQITTDDPEGLVTLLGAA